MSGEVQQQGQAQGGQQQGAQGGQQGQQQGGQQQGQQQGGQQQGAQGGQQQGQQQGGDTNLLAGQQAQGGQQQGQQQGGATNLLADQQGQQQGQQQAAPDEAAVAAAAQAITAAIAPQDVGLGLGADGKPVGWDGEAVGKVAQAMARAGVSPEAAKGIVAAYAEHFRGRIEAERSAEQTLNAQMVADARAAFGADLGRIVGEARRGGEDVFGVELFRELASVPAFANDKRILSALAARGRAVTSDRAPGGAGAATDERDLAARLYGPASNQ